MTASAPPTSSASTPAPRPGVIQRFSRAAVLVVAVGGIGWYAFPGRARGADAPTAEAALVGDVAYIRGQIDRPYAEMRHEAAREAAARRAMAGYRPTPQAVPTDQRARVAARLEEAERAAHAPAPTRRPQADPDVPSASPETPDSPWDPVREAVGDVVRDEVNAAKNGVEDAAARVRWETRDAIREQARKATDRVLGRRS